MALTAHDFSIEGKLIIAALPRHQLLRGDSQHNQSRHYKDFFQNTPWLVFNESRFRPRWPRTQNQCCDVPTAELYEVKHEIGATDNLMIGAWEHNDYSLFIYGLKMSMDCTYFPRSLYCQSRTWDNPDGGRKGTEFILACCPDCDYRLVCIITKSGSDNELWLNIIITIKATGGQKHLFC